MRKDDLYRGEKVVLRLNVASHDHNYWRMSHEERAKKRRFVQATVLAMLAGRKVRVQYEGEVFDPDSRRWIPGVTMVEVDSRSIVRTWVAEEARLAAEVEEERLSILRNTYHRMVEDQPHVERAELIRITLELLDSLDIVSKGLGQQYTAGGQVPTSIQIYGDGIAQLRQFILTATLT